MKPVFLKTLRAGVYSQYFLHIVTITCHSDLTNLGCFNLIVFLGGFYPQRQKAVYCMNVQNVQKEEMELKI
jgi:hypothetical protein